MILLDNYQLVLDKLSSNSVDGARLVCGDKDWKWVVTLGDLGQTPEDKLISDDYNQDGELKLLRQCIFILF